MKRRIAAIVFAIAILFAGTIGVSAETSSPWVGLYYGDSSNLNAITLNQTGNSYFSYRLAFIIYHQGLLPDYTYQFSVSITHGSVTDFYIGQAKFTSDVYQLALVNGRPSGLSAGGNLMDSASVGFVQSGNTVTYTITFNTGDLSSIDFTHLILACDPVYGEDGWGFNFVSASCTAVYDPEKTEMQTIIDNTNTIINNQNNYYQTIIHYGQGNALPQDAGIGAAQNSLHEAESSLKGKSSSLMSKASSGVSAALTASQTHVAALAEPVGAVATTVSTAIAQLPTDVQAGFVAMPLIGFAAWLIGLKR